MGRPAGNRLELEPRKAVTIRERRRARSSRWLRGARASGGGLVVPGRPSAASYGLALAPDGAHLTYEDRAVPLDWADYGSAWQVTNWSFTGSRRVGVALGASRRYAASIRATRHPDRQLFNWLNPSAEPGVRVALLADQQPDDRVDDDRDMVDALCALLAEREELRRRLGATGVARRLLADMTHHPMGAVARLEPRRPSDGGFEGELDLLRLPQRLRGRPVPGDPEVAVETLVAELRSRVDERDPRIPDPATLRRLVEHYVASVEPWPFEALTLA